MSAVYSIVKEALSPLALELKCFGEHHVYHGKAIRVFCHFVSRNDKGLL